MKLPLSKLPFIVSGSQLTTDGLSFETDIIAKFNNELDCIYVANACNNHVKCIELLERCYEVINDLYESEWSENSEIQSSDFQDIKEEINEFLNDINYDE
jgi:hypothetical protein